MELLCCTRSKLSPPAQREQPAQRTQLRRVVLYLLWLSVPALHHECLHPVELHLLGLPQDRTDPFGQLLCNLELVVSQHRPLPGQQLVQDHPIGEHVHLEPETDRKSGQGSAGGWRGEQGRHSGKASATPHAQRRELSHGTVPALSATTGQPHSLPWSPSRRRRCGAGSRGPGTPACPPRPARPRGTTAARCRSRRA